MSGHRKLTLTEITEEGLLIRFDSGVYRLSAIKKAAYKFADRFHVLIETTPGGVLARLRAKTGLASPEAIAGDFCNEVLDQDLREHVQEETAPIRDLLLAQAFSATSLIDGQGEDADYRVDPMEIGRVADNRGHEAQ